MRNYTIVEASESSANWQALEEYARREVQKFHSEDFGGRGHGAPWAQASERCTAVDSREGYRNGHGKPRSLSTSFGTVKLRRPRVRGLIGRFESLILPLFKRRTEEVGKLLPELYLHGLSLEDFDLALRGLLGEGAPLSEGSIVRLKASWLSEYAEAFLSNWFVLIACEKRNRWLTIRCFI